MSKSVVSNWPQDFQTGLAMVPPGEFTDFSQYPRSKHQASVRKLPVLRGFFDQKRFELKPNLPSHAGWGSVRLENAVVLTFRIQLGSNVLYWFANPADPLVWEVIDKWAAAKTIVLAAEFEDAPALVMQRNFALHPALNAMRNVANPALATADFVSDVTQLLVKDEVNHIASSDIPSVPWLQHVQGCMVRTANTGGVVVSVSDEAPGPNGAVADAVSSLMQSMYQPGKNRH